MSTPTPAAEQAPPAAEEPLVHGDREDTSDLILEVHKVTRDGGTYAVRCPHCKDIIGIEGDDLSEVRGEQFQHLVRREGGCRGWLSVSHRAQFVKEL